MRAQLARAGTPGPKVIGIDEISIRKGHTYRIVVKDLIRHRPIVALEQMLVAFHAAFAIGIACGLLLRPEAFESRRLGGGR